jgi:hypothetical protein
MAQEQNRSDQNQALLVSLLMMLSTSAMQQLGKLVNPETRKAEVNLEAAQVSIDMIEMLKQKMRGNLSAQEARMMDDILSSLQMNYVEVLQSGGTAAAQPEEAPKAEVQAERSDPIDSSTPPAGDDKKDPKYHKSYGG